MICVSIGRGRHKHMLAEYHHLAEDGVKLVELRVDYIRSRIDLRRLLADRPCPCIVTCRREADGGQWTDTEQARLLLLRTAVVEGADYVDLEDDIAGGIPRYGKTKRIISYHNFRETPLDLEEIHQRLASKDADIVKIATMTHRPGDNLRMLRLIQQAKIPTVGLCMGEIGMPTRILCGKFGAPFSYATFHSERKMAPGQIGYKQMREIYHYDDINADTEVYGITADPVAHSMHPVVHNAAFHARKMNKVYVPFRVPRDDLRSFMDDCRGLEIKGLSVSIPHKDDVVRFLTQGDGAVRGIGAANTVAFDGMAMVGYNTDYRAFMDSLDTIFPESDKGASLIGKTVLVLGAGGISKAIVFGLRRREAEVVIASRTYDRARTLAEVFKGRAVQWYERMKVEPDILINATPIGMHPNLDQLPFDPEYLLRGMIVFDTVYDPEQTLLVKEARERACRVITGVDMFVRQAALQFKHFTGEDPPEEVMREEFKRFIGPVQW
jgi:3-dehydroquinate dehydratase / shikimate dehydrogenase